MEISPEVENFETVLLYTEEALKKHQEALSLLDDALEIILSARAEEISKDFLNRNLSKRRKFLIRKLAKLLEDEACNKSEEKLRDINKEAYQALTFIKALEKTS